MKIAAIIAEYNPFHNGHLYLAEQVKKETGADYLVAIMSGNFTQRGLPAMADKFTRAKTAIACGIDVVFELPIFYATASAERFASGAVSLVNSLGCIDFLAFGSESGNLSELTELSSFLLDEPKDLQGQIQKHLKLGLSYPNAIVGALQNFTGKVPDASPELLDTPNNMLAIEYLKALQRSSSSVVPYTTTRIGTDYHDDTRAFTDKKTKRTYASASAIRTIFGTKTGSIAYAAPMLPTSVYRQLSSGYGKTLPVELDDFSLLLSYRLSLETAETLCKYLDMSPELANRIIKERTDYCSFMDFIQKLKHKQYTFARINRALLHVLLGITDDYLAYGLLPAPYARLLAMRKSSSELMKTMKEHSQIPLITKAADRSLAPEAERLFALDVFAANLYSKTVAQKYRSVYVNDIRHTMELL